MHALPAERFPGLLELAGGSTKLVAHGFAPNNLICSDRLAVLAVLARVGDCCTRSRSSTPRTVLNFQTSLRGTGIWASVSAFPTALVPRPVVAQHEDSINEFTVDLRRLWPASGQPFVTCSGCWGKRTARLPVDRQSRRSSGFGYSSAASRVFLSSCARATCGLV
jgi:hypothetical protein